MADDRGQAARVVRIDDLRRCLAVAFERLGLLAEEAEGLGGLLVGSELRGHPDHGVAALEVELRYADGGRYLGVSIIELRDGKVVKETDYHAQPFEAPAWRAQWVERT